MSYPDLLEKISSLSGKKTHIAAVQAMSRLLGHPEKKTALIHVAGTNGKGSVSLKIAEALGKKCGLFTSPHLFCFRERIRIGGQKIDEKAFVELLTDILKIANQAGIELSCFELCTLLAFEYFAREKVDFGVIEVGLGGRLDATNIAKPILSVITSVGLDHCELLGENLDEIAREKAGIIKPKVPIVIGPSVPHSIIEPIAKSFGAPLTQVQGVFPHYGLENQAVAKAALEQISISTPPPDIEPPCRFERFYFEKRTVILDVAHNPQGIEKLIERLKFTFPDQPYHFILAMSANKDISTCAKLLSSGAASVRVLECAHPRLAPAQELKKYFPISGTPEQCFKSLSLEKGVIVVCGSFFIMEPIVQILSRAADPHS
jgi:dihydrofolate synthase/folylpolyglutamate synthase